MDKSLIRNFSIIAHIDHGKSTLADRLLLFSGAIDERKFRNQVLDDMDLERERGITIRPQRYAWITKPMTADFIFLILSTRRAMWIYPEVENPCAPVKGRLVVDVSQGVESQTVANYYLAIDNNLEILPVINKIDIVNADIELSKRNG